MTAGGDHFHNYREFMAGNGLAALVTAHRLQIIRQVPVWQGTIAVSVAGFRAVKDARVSAMIVIDGMRLANARLTGWQTGWSH